MEGRIVKTLSDFYYVYSSGEVYQCKAKGLFRKEKTVPLVGDRVEFSLTNAKDIEGNVTEILPRKSQLQRPAVANIDAVLLVFALKSPEPNFYLLDRFLAIMEKEELETILIFNKGDLDGDNIGVAYKKAYEEVGYKCVLVTAATGKGMENIKNAIAGKTVSVAGPSGVGKSTIINYLTGKQLMETGSVSAKNLRGKQTTRHTELVPVDDNTFIVDTPGFSSTDITGIGTENLSHCFPEFTEPMEQCRFAGCAHISEPDCGVKTALLQGRIQNSRYENYVKMYNELKNQRQY